MAALEPWHKAVTLRQEVREGRSFSPDEFAIALEQVVSGAAPEDYRDPAAFFSRTCFTRALTEHTGMVLRRLAGQTANTSPVLTLITQFGGGKTHTLTALYHMARAGREVAALPGVADLLREAGVGALAPVRTGVFVGNAWDPAPGSETPWMDLARQVAGKAGAAALGPSARETAPGTQALQNVFAAADGPILFLLDEVLNFMNRHRAMADGFYAFLQNLTVALTATPHAAAVISLPRSQMEMTDSDQKWQHRITKIVRRVAKDLIANDESEISDVVRRRLFEDIGDGRVRRKTAKAYAKWCAERSARLPGEWVNMGGARTSSGKFLEERFEACYPFHPATLSVFQRKWRVLPQFQQTRGALAMLAQWISWAAQEHFKQARSEALITLGSAPLHAPAFRSVVLGQLGEERLSAAMEADITGPASHAAALDVDRKGPLRDLHKRVGTAILFESSGGQTDKTAHLPELRFALGGPDLETTSVDNAAEDLGKKGFFVRKIGTDGFRINHQATLKKVVNDRRASLDEEHDIKPAMRGLVTEEFQRGAQLPLVLFPEDSTVIPDSPKLTLIAADPDSEWTGSDTQLAGRITQWMRQRGKSPRLYPGALVWCVKKPGRGLRERVANWLAWERVRHELVDGILGTGFDKSERGEVNEKIRYAKEAAKDEVWAGYRFIILADGSSMAAPPKVVDLGGGHPGGTATLCGRVLTAMRENDLLAESVSYGYIDRNWPPAFKESGAWPLTSLRQGFLNGTLTRLLNPDGVLRHKIVEAVERGAFGLASEHKGNGQYGRLWFKEHMDGAEVRFEDDVFLLTQAAAQTLKDPEVVEPAPAPGADSGAQAATSTEQPGTAPSAVVTPDDQVMTLRIAGDVPPEVWNKLGTKVLPKLRSHDGLRVNIDLSVRGRANDMSSLEENLRQSLNDLDLAGRVRITRQASGP